MLEWVISAIFWAVILVWEAAPAIVIWPARKTRVLSVPGAIIGAAFFVVGNAAAWYIASHDPSSTAALIFVVSPAYILGAQLLLAGADVGIRAVAKVWRGRSRGAIVG